MIISTALPDVYKRQIQVISNLFHAYHIIFARLSHIVVHILLDTIPVSYTHLDVYKRQEYMLGVLEREREGLLKIMDQYYEAHSTIKETEKASLCKTFKACLLYTSLKPWKLRGKVVSLQKKSYKKEIMGLKKIL